MCWSVLPRFEFLGRRHVHSSWQGVDRSPAPWWACSLAFFLLSNAAVWVRRHVSAHMAGPDAVLYRGAASSWTRRCSVICSGPWYCLAVHGWCNTCRHCRGADAFCQATSLSCPIVPWRKPATWLGTRLGKTQAHRYHSATTDLVSERRDWTQFQRYRRPACGAAACSLK